jgi:hypothetical protein
MECPLFTFKHVPSNYEQGNQDFQVLPEWREMFNDTEVLQDTAVWRCSWGYKMTMELSLRVT